jgi:hypothetical protein
MSNLQLTHRALDKRKTRGSIHLGGNLIMNNAERVLQVFQESSQSYNSLVVKIDQVEELDLSFIQMCLSLKKSMDLQQKQVSFHWSLPEDIRKLIVQAGIADKLQLY